MLPTNQNTPQDSSTNYAKNLITPSAVNAKTTFSHLHGISFAVGTNEITVLRENKPSSSFKKKISLKNFKTADIEKNITKARNKIAEIEKFRINKKLPVKITIQRVSSICSIYTILNESYNNIEETLLENETYEFRGFTFQETLRIKIMGVAFLFQETKDSPYPYHCLMNVEKKYAVISIDPLSKQKTIRERKKIIGFIIPD